MRGRKRKPVELRLLEGSYKRTLHGPKPDYSEPVKQPEKPKGMNRGASKLWDELSSVAGQYLRESDGPALAVLCNWWSKLNQIHRELDKIGPRSKGFNKLISAARLCSDAVDKLSSRFGLTPADRTRLRAELAEPNKPSVMTRPRTKLDKNGRPK